MGNWQNWLRTWARWWNIPNQSQLNPGSPGDVSPCIIIRTPPHLCSAGVLHGHVRVVPHAVVHGLEEQHGARRVPVHHPPEPLDDQTPVQRGLPLLPDPNRVAQLQPDDVSAGT